MSEKLFDAAWGLVLALIAVLLVYGASTVELT